MEELKILDNTILIVMDEDKEKVIQYFSEKKRRYAKIFTLSEISSILGSDILEMKEKEKFLNDIASSSQDEDVTKALPFEESIDYRFELLEQDALERGIEQGIEQGIKQGESKKQEEMIKNLLKQNVSLKTISIAAGISLEEVKKIAKSFRD